MVAFADAMYSDSTVKTDTVGCFFDDQLMELPATSNIKPPTNRRVSTSAAQSESVYLTRSTELSLVRPKVSTKSVVPFR